MDTDVAAFARQLKQDGIDAARAAADAILAEARTRAAAILEQARADAEAALVASRDATEAERQRFAVEIQMIARDTMIQVRQQIERVLMRLLRARIGEALATDAIVRTALAELIRSARPGSEWEIAVGPRIGKTLVAAAVSDLFKGEEAVIALVEELGRTGLELRTAGGAEALELSEESVAEAFRQMMSPELQRLIDSLSG